MYAAMDSGLAVNPGLIENQIVGEQIQGVSRSLHEEVVFSKTNVTEPRLGQLSAPPVQGPPEGDRGRDQPRRRIPLGAGEETLAPVPAAIANAFFDATGVRLHQYPMTPGRVRAALAAAGK